MKKIGLLLILFFCLENCYSQIVVKQKKNSYAVFKKGSKKKNFIYSSVTKDYNDFYLVKEKTKWGLINSSGEKVTESIYDTIITSGYKYIVQKNHLLGAIDKSGNFTIPLEFENIHSTSKTGGVVKKNGKWAFFENGKLNYDKKKIIFTIPDRFPMFEKCTNISPEYKTSKACADKKLLEYINQNIEYPSKAVDENIEGMVVISFVVTDKGEIENIKILRDIGGGCGDAAKKLFINQKNWVPAIHDGEKVYSKYNIPIRFKLSKK